MPQLTGRASFVARMCQARREFYGTNGIARLAQALGIPSKTWSNYEEGVLIPDMTLLRFLTLTGANPRWLLTGEGEPHLPWPVPVQTRPLVLPVIVR